MDSESKAPMQVDGVQVSWSALVETRAGEWVHFTTEKRGDGGAALQGRDITEIRLKIIGEV